ncbi:MULTISPECIES: hypothetical protein [unclassified Serratia (in: enterobacteria)]|uniref:hypothetical protein n=1 Tax=unclassified Serratia (in: enterobacteria) TaxID=2647522 RepID=UPI003B42E96F
MKTAWGEVAKAFFNANLAFYYESPIVAATGYLLICATPIIFLLLRFASKMKVLDNERVSDALEFELKRAIAQQQSQNMRMEALQTSNGDEVA